MPATRRQTSTMVTATTSKRKAADEVESPASKKSKKNTALKRTALSKKIAAPKATVAPQKTGAPKKMATLKKPSDLKKFAAHKKPVVLEKVAKRKPSEEDDGDEESPPMKVRKIAAPKKATAPKKVADPITKIKIGAQINSAPTQTLDIFVFGEGSAGELGLGARKINGKSPLDVKRPRKNALLSAPSVGVVQLACGGMHGLALTKDNKILSWGVNDNDALGRDTRWNGGLRDMDAPDDSGADDSDDDDSGLNPRESKPIEIEMSGVAPGTRFVQVAASDSASFALTEDGRVYAWGTFRGGDGVLGFSPTVDSQKKPVLLTDVNKIVSIATGTNHVLALDNKGKVYAWGAPEQNQLGRRCVERSLKASALRAGGLSFKRGTRITKIACGSYHSFALDDAGRLWSWGLNNHGQLGHSASVDAECQLEPTLVEALADRRIAEVIGGEHHSMVLTDEGKLLVFGRITSNALGIEPKRFNEDNTLYDSNGEACILAVPTELADMPKLITAATGTETSYAITEDGHAFCWGSNAVNQCGIGPTAGDVLTPESMDNSAIVDRKLIFTGAGGQYGMLASVQIEEKE